MKTLPLLSALAFTAVVSTAVNAQSEAKPASATQQSTKQEAKPAAKPAPSPTNPEKKKESSETENRIAVSEPGVPEKASGSKKGTGTTSHPAEPGKKVSAGDGVSPK